MTVNYGTYGSSLRDLPRLRSTRRRRRDLPLRSDEHPLCRCSWACAAHAVSSGP
jgi:hypothetical protein